MTITSPYSFLPSPFTWKKWWWQGKIIKLGNRELSPFTSLSFFSFLAQGGRSFWNNSLILRPSSPTSCRKSPLSSIAPKIQLTQIPHACPLWSCITCSKKAGLHLLPSICLSSFHFIFQSPQVTDGAGKAQREEGLVKATEWVTEPVL